MASSDSRPSSTSRSVAAATNGFVTLAMRNLEAGHERRSRREVRRARDHLHIDTELGGEHEQQPPGNLRPRPQVAFDERLQRGFHVTHGRTGTSRCTPAHGRTRSSAAPMRNALTSS